MRENFAREIEYLLREVPAEQWQSSEPPFVRGIMYEFIPWHGSSSVTIQTTDDRPGDFGSWKYYFSADSDGSRIRSEIERYRQADDPTLEYHYLLIEAAEALLGADFSPYGFAQVTDTWHLYGPFWVQVYDMDRTFKFNYCEYVAARRMDDRGVRGR